MSEGLGVVDTAVNSVKGISSNDDESVEWPLDGSTYHLILFKAGLTVGEFTLL